MFVVDIACICFDNCSCKVEEELSVSRTTYEALNSQLVGELPILIEMSTSVFSQCAEQLSLARKLYVGSCTKELLAIIEVRLCNLELINIRFCTI